MVVVVEIGSHWRILFREGKEGMEAEDHHDRTISSPCASTTLTFGKMCVRVWPVSVSMMRSTLDGNIRTLYT